MSKLPLGDLAEDLALTEPGFASFLWQLSQRDSKQLPDAVFYGLACSCGAEDVYEILREGTDSDRRRVLKKQLKFSGIVQDIGTALKLLEDSLRQRVAASYPQPHPFPVLIAELERVSERCVRLADCLKQRSKPNQETNSREIDLLVACAWSQVRDADHRNIVAKESPDIADLSDVLTGRPWTAREVDEQTIELLTARPAQKTLSALRRALDRGGHVYRVYGEYAFRCLQAAKVSGRYDVLLDAQEGCWGDDVSRDAETILRQAGTQVMEVALDRWKERPPSLWSILWLEVNPTPAVVQFLLDNFRHYVIVPGVYRFWGLLGEIGARDFLEPLIAEWRPGELAIGNAIHLITEVNDVHDSRLKPILEDTRKRMNELLPAVKSGDGSSLLPKVATPLRCTACKHTYHYHLTKLFLDKKKRIIIGEIVQCKGCGSIETYEMTADTYATLDFLLLSTTALAKPEDADQEDLPIKGYLSGVIAAGRKFKTVSEAHHFLARAVEREPENTMLRKHLANVLNNGNHPELALPHFIKVLQLEPQNAGVTYSVARILTDQGKYQEAIPYVEKLPQLIREGEMENGLRRYLFAGLVEQASLIFEKTGRRIPVWSGGNIEQAIVDPSGSNRPVTLDWHSLNVSDHAQFEQAYRQLLGDDLNESLNKPERLIPSGRSVKVGRNDPCPCGSGRKYKKCCGK